MLVAKPDTEKLIQTVYIVTDDVGMIFGIDKCGVLAMRRGKESECEGITVGRGEVISEINCDAYKYLGIME